MPHPRRTSLFWIISVFLLAIYLWTWTESATISLRVTEGTCTAELYGRGSTIECPGLEGGSVTAFSGKADPPIGQGQGPLERLAPGSSWTVLELRDREGQSIAGDSLLPAEFSVLGKLRRPNEPAGLVLLLPDSDDGWAFLPDGETRRGVWWTWRDGEASAPLQGMPMDKPLVAQAQTLTRIILSSWQGAAILVIAALFLAWITKPLTTRISSFDLSRWQVPTAMVVAGPILFTFGVALHVSVDVLERIPHVQDSVTYLFQAQTLARGELTAPAPPLSEVMRTPHFDQEFLLVRDGRWFGKYPPGYPAVLALGVLAGGHWLVNPLLAAMTVPLVHSLARILYRGRATTAGRRQKTADDGRRTAAIRYGTKDNAQQTSSEGLSLTRAPRPNNDPLNTANWSLLFLATSPFFLVMSGSLMAHPAELFWTSLFMVAWSRVMAGGRHRWTVVAGTAIGMLFLTRQFTALTVGLSFGVGWMVLRWWSQLGMGRPASGARSIRRPIIWLLLTAIPFLLVLLGYQAALTGDPFTDPRLLYWPYDRVGFGPGIGESQNVFTFEPTSVGPAQVWHLDPSQPPRGNSPSLGLYNLGRNVDALEETLFAWPPLLTLAWVWLAFLLRRPSAADWGLLLVAVAIAGGYIAFWASGIAYGPRYFYAAVPALVILSARGVSSLAATVDRRIAVMLFLGLVIFVLVSLPERINSYRGYNFVNGLERSAIEATVQRPAIVIATVSEADWWEYGSLFSGNTPWLDGDVIYARDLGPGETERLRAAFPDRRLYRWSDNQLTLPEP